MSCVFVSFFLFYKDYKFIKGRTMYFQLCVLYDYNTTCCILGEFDLKVYYDFKASLQGRSRSRIEQNRQTSQQFKLEFTKEHVELELGQRQS